MIDKTIHRIWLGDSPEPEWIKPFAATWDRPGWHLRQWSGPEELYPLHNQAIYDQAEEIAPNHAGQLRADVLRYEILAHYGGVYADADFELLRPIDDLIANVECFAAWEVPGVWIANGVMGATEGHPFLARLIDGLAAHIDAHRGQRARPNVLSGPQYLTAVWASHGREQVTVFPASFFYPYSYQEVRRHTPGTFDPAERWPNAIAVHWWHNRRRQLPAGALK